MKTQLQSLNGVVACLIIFLLAFSCKKNDNDENSPLSKSDVQFEEPAVSGNTFYVDPERGSRDGNGSKENPWRTLQEVIEDGKIECYQYSESYNTSSPLELVNEGAPVKGGDRLVLKSGYHGHLGLNRFIFNEWLTIEAAHGETPVFSQIKLIGAFKNIYLKNLTVIKSSYQGVGNYWEAEDINHNTNACVYLQSSEFWGKGSDVKINGLTCMTTEDVLEWTADDWVQKHAGGIGLRSVENVEIVNCHIENVRHGITIEYFSNHSVCMNNTIKNYSGDGSRIISNHVFFGYNTITDCIKVDDNHDDAIQSYSRGEDNSAGTGVLTDVTIRGNLIIGTTNFDYPLAGSPQGIGCFDGMYDHWIIENNIVITDHYHGISFYGMTNSTIANNTVIDQDPDNDTSPWIMITSHKNGSPSFNCIVANNIIARSVSVEGSSVEETSNYIIGRDNYSQVNDLFVNPDDFDMHILDNSFTRENILDKGLDLKEIFSSEMDMDNFPRNGKPDLGAFELR